MFQLAFVPLAVSLLLAGSPGGTARPLDAAALAFAGIADGDATGFAVAAGDLDGDGVGDLVVGAPCHAAGGEAAGAVYVLYGPLEAGRSLADADATLLGTERGDFAGEAVGVADLDGDGDDELLIGSPGPFVGTGPLVDGCFAAPTQPGTNRPGEAYVIEGGERLAGVSDARTAADAVLTGLSSADFFGMGVAGVGDLDGDGDDDLAVGAHGPGSLPNGAGSVHVFTEPVVGAVSAADASTTLLGVRPADLTGVGLGGADLDADGRSDLLVAAPGNAVPPALAGRVHLLHDLPAGVAHLGVTGAMLEGEVEDDFTGQGITTGDLIGDPAPDVAIGAPGSDTVYVVAGGERHAGSVALVDAPVRIDGDGGQGLGRGVMAADLDGDGRDELAVGGPAVGLPEQGGTVAVFGHGQLEGALGVEDADARYDGVPGDNAGFALAAGDLDGDGVDDLVVAAPSIDGGGPGTVYVIPGEPAPGQGSGAGAPAPAHGAPETPADARPAALPTTGGSAGVGALLLTTAWLWPRRTCRT